MAARGLLGLALSLSLIATFHSCSNQDQSATKEASGTKSAGVAEIEKTFADQAKAITDFPRSRDKQSVLRFFTADYVGLSDGEWVNIKEQEKSLSAIIEQLNLGAPIGVSYQVTNIQTHVSPTAAWATYDVEYKLGRGGVPVQERSGKCTAVLRKENGAWLFEHEHCSSAPLARLMGLPAR